jgi:cell wall-associated NlpC family hydrolase
VEAPKVRRTWLAGAAVAAATITIPAVATAGTAHAATAASSSASEARFDAVAAQVAKKFVGAPYAYGGTTPAGFDCSGLTGYVYRHTGGGKILSRTADGQYGQLERISKSAAKPGDLVFFHETSSPSSYVYHVGVYEGGNNMVAATTSGGEVALQSFTWAGDTVTFGHYTH